MGSNMTGDSIVTLVCIVLCLANPEGELLACWRQASSSRVMCSCVPVWVQL